MRITRPRYGRQRAVTSAVLGLLLVGSAGAPAHAESIREQQWFLDAMKAEQMWQTSTGEGITVAVIDSGVDAGNPDLKGRVLPGKDFAPDQPGDERTDYEDHGTGMAGLIAGTGAWNGGQGAFGLAPVPRFSPSGCLRRDSDQQSRREQAVQRGCPEGDPLRSGRGRPSHQYFPRDHGGLAAAYGSGEVRLG